jgi:hypothetical protein
MQEWCKRYSIARSRAQKLIASLIDSGDAECFAGVVLDNQGHLQRQVWYRPK